MPKLENVSPGQVIAGKYRVESVLGQGGMGVVVSATHLGLDQLVAIKLLLSEVRGQDRSAEVRFEREARSAARIQSPHVCRVLDTGTTVDGTPFLVMESLEGADVARELEARGRFDVEEAARLIRQACEAIAEAHEAGIVHRDLKPANLFLATRPSGNPIVKVLDFGVSKLMEPSSEALSLTKTSTLVGSPLYMSPEQLRNSKDVDGRTDIWSLGVILYEMLTGQRPFDGDNMPQLVNAVLFTEPATLAECGVDSVERMDAVLARAMAKKREDRFQSAEELSLALSAFAPDPLVSTSGTRYSTKDLPALQASADRASAADGRAAATGLETGDRVTPPVDSSSQVPAGKRAGKAVWWLASGLIGLAVIAAWWVSRPAAPEPELDRSEELHQAGVETSSKGLAPGAAAPAVVPAGAEPSSLVEEPGPEASPSLAPAVEEEQVPEGLAPDEATAAEEVEEAHEAADETKDAPRKHRASRPRSQRDDSRRIQQREAEPAEPTPSPDDGLPDFGGRR